MLRLCSQRAMGGVAHIGRSGRVAGLQRAGLGQQRVVSAASYATEAPSSPGACALLR